MLPELGSLFLYLALALSIAVAVAPLMERCGMFCHYKYYKIAWWLIFIFVIFAFLILIYSYVISDFSLVNVVNNSHLNKPMIYKISGAWGNHEGSMLLWISAINFFTIIFCIVNVKEQFGKLTLGIQAFLNIFFIAFTIFLSSPFRRIFPPPVNGFGLNPILQDIGLAMHPPVLYLGYVGFSICYSATLAALITNKVDRHWAHIVRICALVSLSFLTAGIALGSWWAYRELGWGGFWFWDPVENASLMPWLSAVALIHAIGLYIKNGQMKQWSIALALLTFVLSIVGMFLVRSGIVTSVHAFATDAAKGGYILLFLTVILLASVMIYIFRYSSEEDFNEVGSIKLFVNINNLILVVAIFTVALGTLYPMILEIVTGEKISVGAPYFNKIFNPMVILLGCFCAICAVMFMRRRLRIGSIILLLSVLLTALIINRNNVDGLICVLGLLVGIWLVLTTIFVLFKNLYEHSLNGKLVGMIFGHVGLGVIMISISLNAAMDQQTQFNLKIGEQARFLDYNLSLVDVLYEKKENYMTQISVIRISTLGSHFTLTPEIRLFEVEMQQTVESAIYKNIFYDLYLTVGNIYSAEDGLNVFVHYKPMMAWLWFGALLIVIACVSSSFDAINRHSARR